MTKVAASKAARTTRQIIIERIDVSTDVGTDALIEDIVEEGRSGLMLSTSLSQIFKEKTKTMSKTRMTDV